MSNELNDKLDTIITARNNIKIALENKGQEVTSDIRTYSLKINSLEVLNGQTATVTPSTSQQVIEPDNEHNALTQVTVEAVTSDIDNNIVAGNIKKDVTILGVTGTLEAGDGLEDTVAALESKINELEAEVEDKAGGKDAKVNVYVQDIEPTGKDGIWLKTNKTAANIYFCDNISSDTSDYIDLSWSNLVTNNSLSVMQNTNPTVVGNYIYFLLSNNLYRSDLDFNNFDLYDTLTLETNFSFLSLVSDSNYLYIFGGDSTSTKQAYKYDVVNKTLTSLTNLPNNLSRSGICKGNKGEFYLCATNLYKYNINIGSYTSLSPLPITTNNTSGKSDLVYISQTNKLYYIGTPSWNTGYVFIYEYNLSNNTWTNLGNVNSSYYWMGNVLVNDTKLLIYFVDSSSTDTYSYWKVYDTLTHTFSAMTSMPNNKGFGSTIIIDNKLYFIKGDSYKYRCYLPNIKLNQDSIYIASRNYQYRTKLTTNIEFPFNDIYITDSNGDIDNTIEKYYGNGTSWVQINQ